MASMTRTIRRNGDQIRRAVAYGRFSSNNQRDESIDAQLRAIREYCERENIKLVEIYTDEAQSATTDLRDDFKNMIDDIFAGKLDVDTVLVHKFNRFARNKYDSAIYKKRLRDIGIKVVSVTQPIDDSPEGRILESLIEAMDEYYSENLALEVKKGMLENALKGKHTGGGKVLGLGVDNEGHYYPDENAHIVKRIFREFADGVPKARIVARLNEEGYRNQYGRRFCTRTLYDYLQNEKYIGNYVYHHTSTETIRLDGIIKEPIIDLDLWEKVQEQRRNKNKPRYRKRKYIMTGKLRCGVCGFTYCGAGGKKGNGAAYYKCAGKNKHKGSCHNPSLNKDYYENLIINTITENVLTDNAIERLSEMVLQQLEKERKAPQVPTAKLQKQLDKVKDQQSKLMDLYINGGIEMSLLEEKNKALKAEKRHLEEQIEKNDYLESSTAFEREEVKWFLKDFRQSVSTTDAEYAQILFSTFVDQITVNEEHLDVTLRVDFSTLRGDKMKSRGPSLMISHVVIKKRVDRRPNHKG